MGARENEFQISQNYILHMKFSEFYLCFHNSCEIWHSFSWASMRNSLWCYYRWLSTSLGLKNVKKDEIFFKLFWYKVFVHWELKLLNFLVDSVLKRHNNSNLERGGGALIRDRGCLYPVGLIILYLILFTTWCAYYWGRLCALMEAIYDFCYILY